MKIAFQGEPGAYSHEAILAHWGQGHKITPSKTFKEVFERTTSGEADCGFLPLENSLTGSIHEVYDLLLEYPLFIIGEAFLKIEHALLGLPGSRMEQIEHIYSHPQALWQCETFLETVEAQRHAFYDTAGAARWVAEQKDPRNAAIAGRLTARLYGLVVLKESIATSKENTTRFIAIARNQLSSCPQGACKTSVVIELPHEPGALHRALEPFAKRGINLTKLESRPLRTENWQYRFYLDFEGYQDDSPIQRALEELKEHVVHLRVLGSYPQGTM